MIVNARKIISLLKIGWLERDEKGGAETVGDIDGEVGGEATKMVS